MNEASLPSPDIGTNGYHLRRMAAKSLSAIDIASVAYRTGHPSAAKLAAFFTACADAALSIAKAFPVLTLTPNTSSGIVGSTQQLTLGKGGSSGTVTWVSLNTAVATVNSAGLVTRVAKGITSITANVAEGSAHRASSISATVAVV